MTPPLLYYPRVTSALDVLHELAGEGAEPGTAVVAGEQSAGRGARGDTWHSPPGGVWLAVLSRPTAIVEAPVLSIRAGLAVARALGSIAGEGSISIKWPNDLILQDRKLGGILCEARWQGDRLGWIAVGVGLNVTNNIPAEVRESAIALGKACPGIVPEDVVPAVVAALRSAGAGGSQLTEAEQNAFAGYDWLRGRALSAPAPGTALGISPDGGLMVETEDGVATFRAGRVVLAARNPRPI